MATNETLLQNVASLSAEVDDLRKRQVRWLIAEVSAVDAVNAKIEVLVPEAEGGGTLGGIDWPASFLPEVGSTVRMIVAGAQPLSNPDAIAQDAVTGRELKPGSVGDTHLEPMIVLSTVFVAGNPSGEHVRLDATGLKAFVTDPVDGIPDQVAQFGRNSGGIDPVTGRQTWGITDVGRASFQQVTSTEDPIFQGQKLSALLANGDARMVSFGQTAQASYTGIGTGELGVMEVSFIAKPGRAYAVMMTGLVVAGSVVGDDVVFRIRNGGTSTPQTSSALLAGPFYDQVPAAANRYHSYGFAGFLLGVASGGSNTTMRLLLTVSRGAGGSGVLEVVPSASTGNNCNMLILDVGPNVTNTGVVNLGGAPPPGGTTIVQRYDQQWDATWSQTYNGSNVQDPIGDAIQGYSPNYVSRGNARALIGFPDLTGILSGSSIEYVEISMYANHWHYASGGTMVGGWHGFTSAPGTWSAGGAQQFTIASWARGQRRAIDLTGLSWGASLKTGAIRGIAVGPGLSTDPIYYGRFNEAGVAEPPRIRVIYYK